MTTFEVFHLSLLIAAHQSREQLVLLLNVHFEQLMFLVQLSQNHRRPFLRLLSNHLLYLHANCIVALNAIILNPLKGRDVNWLHLAIQV